MKSNCKEFRLRLRAALEGGLRGESSSLDSMRPLAWHEHLFTCDECRSLLEAEEALEEVLASLPAPMIPKALARRVLERLLQERHLAERAEESGDLDSLLAEADGVDVPEELANRVLSGLASQRDAVQESMLDAALDLMPEPVIPTGLVDNVLCAVHERRERDLEALLSLVPAPEIPTQLGARILDSLEAERLQPTASPILRPRFGALRYVAAMAATLVVAFGVWRVTSSDEPNASNRGNGLNGSNGRDGLVGTNGEVPNPDALAGGNGTGGSDLAPRSPEDSDRTQGKTADTEPSIDVAVRDELPDANVLASLDVLEDWELLFSDDIDLLLGSLGEADAELLFLIEGDEVETTEEG